MIFGEGKMVGDYECINNVNYLSTVNCVDQEAKIYKISKEDFMKIREAADDNWRNISINSETVMQEYFQIYV